MAGHTSQYRQRAEKCLRLAKAARDPTVAELFEQLAEQWLRVAENFEKVETYLAIRRAISHRRVGSRRSD
jgi:hypothetical protein